MVRIAGKADTGTQAHGGALGLEGFLDEIDQVVAHGKGALFCIRAGQEQGEFIAAEAGCDVRGAQERRQAVGKLAQNTIARGVAMVVVDRLETVEIDEEAGDRGADLVGLVDLLIEDRLEPLAVQETRQVVGDGLMVVADFRLFEFCDVGHDAERAHRLVAGHGLGAVGPVVVIRLVVGAAAAQVRFRNQDVDHAAIETAKAHRHLMNGGVSVGA